MEEYSICALDECEVAWKSLVDKLPNASFFHRWEWYRAGIEHLVPNTRFHWFHEGKEPIAVFPLEDVAARPWAELRSPQHTETFLRDGIVSPQHVKKPWPELFGRHIRTTSGARPSTIRFHLTPQRNCLNTPLLRGHKRVRVSAARTRMFSRVETAESLGTLSSKNLKNVDRLRRRAVRDFGSADVTTYFRSEAAGDGLDVFASVEAASWKGPNGSGTSLLCTPPIFRFYRAVLSSFGACNDARVDVLHLGGEPAAAQLVVRTARRWSILKIGFDERFSAVGPGSILLKHLLEELAEDDMADELSLVTAPGWARRWHMDEEPVFNIAVFMNNVAGSIHMLRHDTIQKARRIKRRLSRNASE